MNVLIQGAVQALGYCEDGKYHREPDCYETIRDLIRYLREDGEDYTARIECGRHNLIEHDLVPMVKCEDLSDEEFDIAIRLMVNLCQPAISTMRGKPPTDRDQWKMYWELEENLRRAKSAFTDAYFFVALKKRIDSYFIDTEYEDRDERLQLVVERIVLLIKYVFSINQDSSEGRRTRIEDSSHDRVIQAFLESGIDKTLMHIANQPREKEFHITILDIFALILKEQSPEVLSKPDDDQEVSAAEKKKTEEEFRKIIENHVVRETQKRKSFSRFGGSYTIQGLNGISKNSNQVVFKPIQNVEKHNFFDERKTKKRVARNRRPFEIDTNVHLASSEVRKMLRDMITRLIETCFNRVMKSAKSTVFVQGHVIHKTSQINYFFMVKFVLRFVRMSKNPSLFERISECTGVEAFHENNVQLTEYVENATTLKGVEAKSFGIKAQYALGAYNELVLLHRHIVEHGKDEGEKKRARRALEHITNVEEYRELPISIMKKFSTAVLSNNFLRELVLTTHHYVKLVEKFVKAGALKKVSKKVKIRKTHKKPADQDERSIFDEMSPESLDLLWAESKDAILNILQDEMAEIEDMNPINAQLEVSQETHKRFAQLAIQRSLRARGFPAAVGLYHASKKIWDDGSFGGPEAEELAELEKILRMDLKKVAKELRRAESKIVPEHERLDKMTQECLTSFWEDSKTQELLLSILNKETPESEDANPLNWQLEVSPESQQQFAMLFIQRALRAKDLPKAVGLYHASRRLWPADSFFGSEDITVEKEVTELEGILKADLGEVAKEMKVAEDAANRKLDGVEEDEDQVLSEDEEEAAAFTTEEVDFQFEMFVTKFANVDVLKWYVFLLNDFSKNSVELNQALVKMLHRIAFDLKLTTKLYQISLFQVFQKVNEHFAHLSKELRKTSPFYELYQFGFHLLKKFFAKYAEMGTDLAIEALFWKGPRECFEIENGYGSYFKSKEADTKVWTEDLETELRNLYDEYRSVESEDGIDVLDFIGHSLSRSRSRKQIAKKLIEFGLDLLGAKWKNLGHSRMDEVLPVGDIQKWYEEWKESGAAGDVVDVLKEKLTESLGSEISRKKIIKQLAHMDIHYEKPRKEKKLPAWDGGLIEELTLLKEQYDGLDDLEKMGVNIVPYVMKRLSVKKPTRQVERFLASMGAEIEIVERPQTSEKKSREERQRNKKKHKTDDFVNDSSEDEQPARDSGDEDDEELAEVLKTRKSEMAVKKRIMLDSDDDDDEPARSPAPPTPSEEPKEAKTSSPKKNTLMSLIANKKRKLAQLASDSDSSDSEDESQEKRTKRDSDDDSEGTAMIYKRSYESALLIGSVASGYSERRETSEEPEEEQEDPFTKKIKFKRRIVMSDNEDED